VCLHGVPPCSAQRRLIRFSRYCDPFFSCRRGQSLFFRFQNIVTCYLAAALLRKYHSSLKKEVWLIPFSKPHRARHTTDDPRSTELRGVPETTRAVVCVTGPEKTKKERERKSWRLPSATRWPATETSPSIRSRSPQKSCFSALAKSPRAEVAG